LVSFSSRAAAAYASRCGGVSSVPFHRSIFASVRGDEWLAEAAKHYNVKINNYYDLPAADRARSIGLTPPPPERIP
jgi:hypothetical protein